MRFWDFDSSANLKKKNCRLLDFAVAADHRVKIKECEKMDKYMDLGKEQKTMRNMAVAVFATVSSVLGTVRKV